jgi:hypothetical protein
MMSHRASLQVLPFGCDEDLLGWFPRCAALEVLWLG